MSLKDTAIEIYNATVKPALKRQQDHAWTRGFVTALAEMHRRTKDSRAAQAVAHGAGNLTIAEARKAGAADFDLDELARAGLPKMTMRYVSGVRFTITAYPKIFTRDVQATMWRYEVRNLQALGRAKLAGKPLRRTKFRRHLARYIRQAKRRIRSAEASATS